MALSSGPNSLSAGLPTNYEYFTSGGINNGLNANQTEFTLNDRLIRIYSGAMHYFRVPRPYWRDRLKKIRAAGLNTVETYVPWNLHEPESGKYDFGNGGSEFEDFLHLEEFLKTAKEEDLFVILRTGPYICSEYNFGGFPSWLLREKPMGFRTSEPTYMKFVSRYFNVLLTLLAAFQFTKGGPVIAFQVENEYGYMKYGNEFDPDKVYLEELHQLFVKNGIVELLVTSDGIGYMGLIGTLPGVFLATDNYGGNADQELTRLAELQPGRPLMTMEFWVGWFDFWGNNHNPGNSDENVKNVLGQILAKNGSFNIYMFHGGTNFAFNNGGSLSNQLTDNSGFLSVTTSYDYAAPLSENGAYTNKYYIIKDMVAQVNPVQTLIPDPPEYIPPVAYNSTKIEKVIPLKSVIDLNAPITINSKKLVAMEMLDINNGSGQSNGYIVYRKENIDLDIATTLKIEGHVCDTLLVLVNGKLVAPMQLKSVEDLNGFGFWKTKDSSILITSPTPIKGATIDLVVEEMGRINGGAYFQYNKTFKGLWQGDVLLNDEIIEDWQIIPLELKKKWVNNLQGWKDYTEQVGSGIYKSILHIDDEPKDTFIDVRNWGKGMAFVNGFNLGRYAAIGPQGYLYLPAPFLVKGDNEILFFEHFYAPDDGLVTYSNQQIFIDVV